MSEEQRPPLEDRLTHARSVFAGWHREPSLWREIYTRTVATLLAAFVAYLVALISGQVTARPLFVVLWAVFGISVLALLRNVAVAVPIWRHVRPLFVRWNRDPSPEAVRARRVYNPLVFSIYGTLLSGLMLLTGYLAR